MSVADLLKGAKSSHISLSSTSLILGSAMSALLSVIGLILLVMTNSLVGGTVAIIVILVMLMRYGGIREGA